MGRTAAVRGAEARQRQVSAPGLCVNFSPLMLPPNLIIGVPYFANAQGRPQVIQVPVGPAGMIEMVLDAGLQTARTEGAADIYVITGFEDEGAEFADIYGFFICTQGA